MNFMSGVGIAVRDPRHVISGHSALRWFASFLKPTSLFPSLEKENILSQQFSTGRPGNAIKSGSLSLTSLFYNRAKQKFVIPEKQCLQLLTLCNQDLPTIFKTRPKFRNIPSVDTVS
ncbi:hypothetical protein ACF0H5_023504 [Mactra antiquata]